MYADVTVVVEGAVEEEKTVFSNSALHDLLSRVEEEARTDKRRTEVYILRHNHHVSECECSQYVQDGRPEYTWN